MKDLLFGQQRADSLRVECEYCGKRIGEACVNPRTSEPLQRQAAHLARITASSR
ncbi:MAG: zinc finger domain-containing protein [Pseudonocardiaceae bacterium]